MTATLDSIPLTLDPPITTITDWAAHSTRPDLSIYNYDDQPWRESAACRSLPTNIFFPPSGSSGEPIRDICFSCPVRLDCLDYALFADEPAGWFGGHPYSGRKTILKLLSQRPIDLETADAIVLKASLTKMRNRRPKTLAS